jgi:hypothetical protein
MPNCRSLFSLAFLAAPLLCLAACGDDNASDSAAAPSDASQPKAPPDFSGGGFLGIGGGSAKPTPTGIGVGVNAYLWRASLDTVSFMPLASADPFGGVIITDWFTPPESPTERFKVNIYILDRELHADGIKASVFRQTKGADGTWADAPVDPKTADDLENQILTRARQMRIASAEPKS